MSKVADLARAEADEVEAADAEETEAADAHPEPEPEPTPEPAPEASRAPVDPDKIERAVKQYMTAMARAFGDSADQLQPCTRCSPELLGFEPAQPPIELRQAPDKTACPLCEGLGTFLSGAKLGEWVTVACTRCNGKGYVDQAMDAPVQPQVVSYLPTPPVEPYPGYGIAFVPLVGGSPDNEGRPAGHPHWGMPRDYQAQSA